MKKLFALVTTLMLALTLAACDGTLEDQFVDITLQSNIDVDEVELTQDPPEATEGMEVTVTASEVDGYDFVSWTNVDTEEEVSTGREHTFIVEEAVTLEAIYEESTGDNGNGEDDTYTVDLSSTLTEASLTASPEGPYAEGDEVIIEASEVDGYTFDHWLDTSDDTVLSEDMSYTFNIDGDMSITAVYEEDGGSSDDYTLDLTSDLDDAGLTVSPEGPYEEGDEVTIEAPEVDGHTFDHWLDTSDDTVLSEDMSHTFTIDGDMTIEAVYEEDGGSADDYTLDLASDLDDAGLTVSPDGPYAEGDQVTIEAAEVDTYTFDHWLDTSDDTILSEARSYTVTVDGDMTIEAVYEDALTADERTAETIVNEASSDTAYLDTLMTDFDPAEGMTMTMHMGVEEEDPETGDPVIYDMQVELATTMEGDTTVSKASFTMDMPNMQDPMIMTMIMEEGPDSTTLTMNTAMLLDMLQADEGIDIRTLMDMDSDYVHITIPHEIEGSDQEALYNQLMDEIYTQMFGEDYTEADIPDLDQTTMDSIMESMNDLKALLNFSNLDSYEDVDLTMSRDGHVATGSLALGGDALEALAEDLFEEIYTTAVLLDDTGELMPYSEVITTQEYNMYIGALGMIPEMTMTMEYDAAEETMHMDMDIYTLLNFFLQDDPDFSNVQDITMEMTMEQGGTIDDDIANSENLEGLAEEFIKIMTVVNTGGYLGNIQTDTSITAGTYTLNDLETMGYHIDLPFVDKALSEVTIDDSGETPVYSIELYYAESGNAVFDGTSVTLDELYAVMGDEPSTRQDVLDIITFVGDANFDFYTVLGDMLAMMVEQSEQVEPSNPIPTEDQVTGETEPTVYDRYPNSVWTEFAPQDTSTDIYTYVVDDTHENVLNYFDSYFYSSSDWTLHNEQTEEKEDKTILHASNTSAGYEMKLEIYYDNGYDTGIKYMIYLEDTAS